MCSTNSASLEVSYGHLAEMQSLLAIWLTDVPRDMLKIFDDVLQSVVLDAFPHYSKVLTQSLRCASAYSTHIFNLTLLIREQQYRKV
jgi:hypothetical protein